MSSSLRNLASGAHVNAWGVAPFACVTYGKVVNEDAGTEVATPEAPSAPVEHEIERRAACDSLNEGDKVALRRSKAVNEALTAGKTIADAARELGDVSRSVLSRLYDTDLYRACLRVLARPRNVLQAEEAESALNRARHLLALTLPDAVEYLRSCLAKDPATGKPADTGLAQWATQELLKMGALKQDGANGAVGAVITPEAMRVLLGAIRGDDKKRESAVTVTATVVPALPGPTDA